MAQVKRSSARNRIALDRVTIILLVVFVIAAIVAGFFAFRFFSSLVKSWTITSLDGAPVDNGQSAPGTISTTSPGGFNPSSAPTAEPWDGNSRVTILLMGLDFRDWESGEVPRTDTMMLLTVDPLSRTAGMLSIPRDMWVNIPGYDYSKINNAYRFGELDKVPGGGPGLAMQTVEEFLGVPIQYYVQVDFDAFVKIIDEVGGVKVDVPQEITLEAVGSLEEVTLQPGRVTLPGNLALSYARIREGAGDDFGRAARQQQVIMGVRDRILDFNQLPTLIAKAPAIYNELSSGIHTNLTLDQIIQLAWLMPQIDKQNIKSAVIGTDAVEFGKSPDGLDILRPIPDKVRLVRDEVFTTGGPVGPAAVAEDPVELMKAEAATVSLQNGTATAGLASKTTELLKPDGLNIVEETNADGIYDVTTIFVYGAKPYTVRYLIQKMGLENARVVNRYDPSVGYDIAVALGNDWAAKNP
ncbi:transcriptional attenuator, LytR family [Longilinea arvoryzae]|uniref:Transcriptional attenuator, LytR family n=1 Tax=Longilinea arvoryzae TaxID=360412 RepID=A0A0S7B7Q4_9CHLR|nr:LCP family protein [Longilinea arvoryzae]GAP13423.1 transcriptional attenuator, LytR family [Longilinea arvoryzae]